MSGYVLNFLEYTIAYLTSLAINGKSVTENDVISVQVGSDLVTWECFKESVKDILKYFKRCFLKFCLWLSTVCKWIIFVAGKWILLI